ncbi:succinylglutamate desuccinylase/aspartoacylase family protein [Robertkochia sediminum]|uniref:succinylglutamate desuccinylase/aspartoacylase family protein n=1 Tax=Robertkochia sediminum TaxID=2785326 RepID=UPI00193157C1|nr:succinylglutamate desuccinylase/aspartoacylase family protein [Robertkochia sediminum]MBL7471310.1 succinylglutamate desuccinylase/aspartoacylase family protein [Robertkochia sediminum]
MKYTKISSDKHFDLAKFPKGEISKFWLHIINNGLGEPIRVPILVARGQKEGPVLGLNAALHGNELNGINVIQRVFDRLDSSDIVLKGTVIGILVANVPGVLLGQRRFNDDFDLNRQAPGSENGIASSVYIHRLIDRVIKHFDYFLDLHTTGYGKQNCWHIRADLSDKETKNLALLQNPEAILHSTPDEKTLRGYASSLGIKSLTLELKDPFIFQPEVVNESAVAIWNVMNYLDMVPNPRSNPFEDTWLVEKSRWMRSNAGGILTVFPEILSSVEEGEKIAEVRNIFGELNMEFFAPNSGIVIAKNVNPIAQTGSAILNLAHKIERVPCHIT